jgi:hypothetical protein
MLTAGGFFCGIGLTYFITLLFAATLLSLNLAQAPSSHTLLTRLFLSTRRQRRYVAVTTDTVDCLQFSSFTLLIIVCLYGCMV